MRKSSGRKSESPKKGPALSPYSPSSSTGSSKEEGIASANSDQAKPKVTGLSLSKETQDATPPASPNLNDSSLVSPRRKKFPSNSDVQVVIQSTAIEKEELEKKIVALSHTLEEKAEENIMLNERLKKAEEEANARFRRSSMELERLLQEMGENLRAKEEETTILRSTILKQDQNVAQMKELNSEYQRRIQVLTVCLEDMIKENADMQKPVEPAPPPKSNNLKTASEPQHVEKKSMLQSAFAAFGVKDDKEKEREREKERSSSKGAVMRKQQTPPPPQSAPPTPSVSEVAPPATRSSTKMEGMLSSTNLDSIVQELQRATEERNRSEETITALRTEIEDLKQQIGQRDKRIVQLNTKLMEAINKKTAFEESVELYEQKIKSIEKEMTENIQQEGLRRQEAEHMVSKLRKKLAELQFLLDERDDDDEEESDEESGESEEDDDDEEEENPKKKS